MSPTVSVVVPTYNNADHIERTMSSILAQTFHDMEIIVSDHSSDDGTWERLQQYADDPRLSLMQLPRGGGAPANWKFVSQQATGRYVKLVCGDDLIYPTCLAEQVTAIEDDPDVVLVACQRDILDDADRPIVKSRGLHGLSGKVPGRVAVRRTVRAGTNVFGEPGCILMNREVLAESGWWDARSPYLIDQATASRVALRGSIFALRRSLAGFRISDQQWSVALAQTQAEDAARFHRLVAAENPGLLSEADVRLGDRKAAAMAWIRRSTYVYLRQRMRLRGIAPHARRRQAPARLG
jgi:glycosyltransferase involved in cell wall biosynthesis